MKFSEGRLSHLAHRIVETLRKEGMAELPPGRDKHVLTEIKRVMSQDHERAARIDAAVRKKIASLSRHVPPGSREWDVLYKRYSEEELRKQKS